MIVFFLKRPTNSLLRKETFANFTNPIKPAKQPIMIYAIIILSVSLVAAIPYLLTVSRRQSAIEAELAVRNATTAQLNEQLSAARMETSALRNNLSEKETAFQREKESRIRMEAEVSRLQQQIEADNRRHEEERRHSIEEQQKIMQQSEANFKILANEIMQRHTTSLREQNEQRLGEILTPLKENIDQFRRDVSQCYSNEARERFSLQEKIKELIEANNSIGREAKELATALRGNSKKQGDWGELVLESILENSGLRKGEEFYVQQQNDEGVAIHDNSGRGLRPDVIVRCPDGKSMIIDSKVSLTAFVDYVNSDDPAQQEQYGKLHLASVTKHINELSDKNYQDYFGKEKLDFVMMFIPNEGAYSAAMTLDPSLWQKAYDKRVLIVSPTQLVGSLRLISQLWSHDRQTRNAIEIAEKSGQMYDKFVGFIDDMERIDKNLAATRVAYDNAFKKLKEGKGNLINRAQTLRELGVKASKKLREGLTDQSEE